MKPLTSRKVLAYLIGLFAAGAMAGAAAGYSFRRGSPPKPPQPGQMTERLCDRFTRDLKLTPEQRHQIEPIVRESVEEISRLQHECGHKIRDAIRASHQKMAAFLKPDQIAELEKIERRHAERFNRGHPPEGGERPGGEIGRAHV